MTQNEKKLSFEEAMASLEEIVRQLESGKVKLEEAVTAYEKGCALVSTCEKKLQEARLKVEKIKLSGDGKPMMEPFDEKL